MMTTLRLFMIVAFLATVGCDQVYIDAPIGEKLSRDKIAKLQGKWADDDQNSFELRVSNEGQLIFGVLAWDDKKQQFEATIKPLDVRTIDDALYVFIADDKKSNDVEADSDATADQAADSDDPNLVFCRVELINEAEMHLFLPESTMIRQAVASGKLGGKVEKRDKSTVIFIDAMDERSQDFIAAKRWGTLFNSKPTLKFKLIKKEN